MTIKGSSGFSAPVQPMYDLSGWQPSFRPVGDALGRTPDQVRLDALEHDIERLKKKTRKLERKLKKR